jgi:hypothetical protein
MNVIAHVLRSVFLPASRDIATLREVSYAMKEAVMMSRREYIKELQPLSELKRAYHRDPKKLKARALCGLAALQGRLEVLQWLRASGCPWDTYTCANAAKGGHFKLLKLLRANGCPWDATTCSIAAHWGHLEVLKWAHMNGCPWNKDTCSGAANSGHLAMLQWARANRCPWDATTCGIAAHCGHLGLFSGRARTARPVTQTRVSARRRADSSES